MKGVWQHVRCSCMGPAMVAASRRRSWRKLHIGIDVGSGEIVAIDLTRKDVEDAPRTETLLD